MVKSRKNLFLVLVMILVLAMSMSMLVACNTDKNKEAKPGEYDVTFMVKENGNGAWKEVATVKSNTEGVVTLPNEPVIPGYSFRAWYTDEACQNKFEGKNVTANMKVYAFMSDKLVTVNVKGADGTITKVEKQTVAGLNKLEETEAAKAKAANLTFDGFYTNEGYTTKFDINSESTVLYARYAANVVFNNGYEDLANVIVNPGEKVAAPAVDKIAKPYMDKEDIFFVKDNGDDYVFDTDTFAVNTVVKVLWKTPFLEFAPMEGSTTNYFWRSSFKGGQEEVDILAGFPVISIPSRITVQDPADETKRIEKKVVAIKDGYGIGYLKQVKKIIINDGIKYVNNLIGNNAIGSTNLNELEAIVLPKDLVILEGSFNNMANSPLKGIELPSSLEVIYDCFWSDYFEAISGSRRGNTFAFDINIPASVTNVVLIPGTNAKFAEGSPFVADAENNRVYKVDGAVKTLVSDVQANVKNGAIRVPDDVTALQVGVYDNMSFDYLIIPNSVNRIMYNTNANVTNYKDFYTGYRFTDMSKTDVAPEAYQSIAYCVVNDLENHDHVVFEGRTAYPVDVDPATTKPFSSLAFAGDNGKGIVPYNEMPGKKVVYTGAVAEGKVELNIKYTNTTVAEYSGVIEEKIDVNTNLTKADILTKVITAAGLDEAIIDKEDVIYTILGDNFEDGIKNSNQYIEVVYHLNKTGVTVAPTKDNPNELVVTGFDKNSALVHQEMYKVFIPSEVDGKKVVEIADNAFNVKAGDANYADVQLINEIVVGSNIRRIGKNAFANLTNLAKVSVPDGAALETIDDGAFKYAGSVVMDGKRVANPNLPKVKGDTTKNKPTMLISFPLANIKYIGAEAFNTPAIRKFDKVESEAGRFMNSRYGDMFGIITDNVNDVNKFYFINANNESIGIVKYTGDDVDPFITGKDGEIKTPVHNFEYIANAPGNAEQGSASMLMFGSSNFQGTDLYRYTIKNGAISQYEYLNYGFIFAFVAKVEAGAFVDIDPVFTTVDDPAAFDGFGYYPPSVFAGHAAFLTKDQIINMTQTKFGETQNNITNTIFEDGWFMGQDNAKNTFMKHIYEFS